MITITITGCELTPSWETLQQALREAINSDTALLTRIRRVDGGVDYRACGEYDLCLRLDRVEIPVQLIVTK